MAGWPRERDPDPNSLYLIFRKILDPDPNSLYISDLQGDHVDAARILVHHKAPVDEVTVDYLTALHVAAHCGQYSQYIYIFFVVAWGLFHAYMCTDTVFPLGVLYPEHSQQ